MPAPSSSRPGAPSALLPGFAAILLLGACSVLTPRPVVPISEVVNLSKTAQPDQVVNRVRASRTSYALRGSDFGKLADAGVAPKVLDHLQQSFYNDVDLLTRYWVQYEPLGGCASCYPQPLDLATLADGGSGMADASRITHYATFGRPYGLPDWVTAVPGKMGARGITVAQAAQMVTDGKPTADIVAEIDRSRIHDFIAQAGISNVGTHFLVGLTGSELAQLHQDGVPDPVLDALQRKTLAEFIEFHRIRYQSWGKGSQFSN